MYFLKDVSGTELVALASAFAIFLSQGLSPDEIDTLGNFLAAVGANLSTIASAQGEDAINLSYSNFQ